MAQVTLTINGVKLTCDAKAVPSVIKSLSGNTQGKEEKKYIGESDLAKLTASTPEELVLKALALQDGIHTRYSGLNQLIRNRFAGKDPVAITEALAKAGKITIRPTKGGVVINLKK